MLKNLRIIFFFLIFISLFPVTLASAQQEWPDWFSQVVQWVNEGLISQQEFDHALEYLVKTGIALDERPNISHESENQEMGPSHRQAYL